MGGFAFIMASSLFLEKVLRLSTFQVLECFASVHLIIQYALLVLKDLFVVDVNLSTWAMYGEFGPPNSQPVVTRFTDCSCLGFSSAPKLLHGHLVF
jgi:hypothetical protein